MTKGAAPGMTRGLPRTVQGALILRSSPHGILVLKSLLLLCFLASAAGAQRPEVAGIVYLDANGNGVRDSGERGIAAVAVSNQDTVVVTDANGAFRLPRGATGIVFVSVPDGYRSLGPFWRTVGDSTSGVAFGLAPGRRVREF